jgi:hypothetical protein
MADIGWSLSGIDTLRWRVQAGSLWRPPVTVRRDVLTLPGRHGVVVTGKPPVFEEPTVTLELLCEGAQPDLEALTNELLGILAQPALTLGRYSGGLVTAAPAQFVSLSPGEFVPDVGAFFTVALAVPGVFLRGASADTAPVVVTDGDTVTLATLAGSTGPVPDAVLRVRGGATSVQLVDAVTGTGLSWAGLALASTDYLFLHAATLTARRSTNPAAWATGGAVVTGQLDYPGPGPLQLWPAMEGTDPADRRVKLTVTGTGFDATTALAVRAQPSYL